MSQQEFFFVDDATGALRGSFVGSADEAAAYLVAEFADGGVSIANEPPATPISDLNKAGKAECARRIVGIVDLVTQTNILGALHLGLLTTEQQAIFQAGYAWIGQMQATWPALVQDGLDIYDDANWPDVPPGVAEMAAEF